MKAKFDYSISTPLGRRDFVAAQCSSGGGGLSQSDLSALADYMLFVGDASQTKRERCREYPIVTRNRSVTVSKREVSSESLVDDEGLSSEEVLSGMPTDVSVLSLDRKFDVSVEDSDIPYMRDNMEAVRSLQRQMDAATGRRKFDLKRQIISKYQEQHIIRESYLSRGAPIARPCRHDSEPVHFDDSVTIDPKTLLPVSSSPVSLFDERCVLALMNERNTLWDLVEGDFQSDVRFIIMDLDRSVKAVYGKDPAMLDFIRMKQAHVPNSDIVERMRERHGMDRSEQWFSTLWTNRVPREVADWNRKQWLLRHWVDPVAGKWKVCSKCGRALLAHPMFFSRNTSRDGYYSVCKQCRAKKRVTQDVTAESKSSIVGPEEIDGTSVAQERADGTEASS